MINRPFTVFAIAGALVLFSAMSGEARPRRRIAQNCAPTTRTCRTPVKRLVPCPNDVSRLCAIMRGDQIASAAMTTGNRIEWRPIAGATHYQVSIQGYNWEWQSDPTALNEFDYSHLPLKPGHAYLATVVAYDSTGKLNSTEQAINIPVQVTANSQ
jgi:hypothetical protein